MDTTAHDLKLLSIGYFIQGGIVIFSGLVCVGYLGLIEAVFASARNSTRVDPRNQMPEGILLTIGVIVIVIALLTLAFGALMLYAAVSLRQHRNRTLVLVMAALNCMAIPYGTVLGIFTFLVLQRAAAKEIFDVAPQWPIAPA
jgi:amino acid transporter